MTTVHGIIEVRQPHPHESDTLNERVQRVEHLLHDTGLVMPEVRANGDKIRFDGPEEALFTVLKHLIEHRLAYRLTIESLDRVSHKEMGSDGG
ncbi:hypothetical protein COU77_00580 [Candidatus Peregrinibacteria bacterium CG10_big_fil_rev_8_21_14_0_10_49_16]|nr:MAG: hypothetical protein COW95_01730 [Candidatus Peregrinibacteria bacterium CG22_combo_CG10-13_8_21_14_all_49_11]PIR52393.1 MAG: hypothetical protein COU77_00580 [Candidatus Peregrinibacteria bacterium CG10_big_fil_rev_8_21_14_0_10_49_16]